MHILVIEDDVELARLIRRQLAQERHVIDVVHDGPTGLERATSCAYDAAICDVLLPGMTGWNLVRRLRSDGVTLPILFLTARGELRDRLRGFEVGADDYLVKPFAFEEMVARLHAIMRRGSEPLRDAPLVIGDLILDPSAREATRAGKTLSLAPREFSLLEYLMRHPGQALSRTLILEHVWDYSFDSFANVVDVAVLRLRRVVDDGHPVPLIQTVRGVGYKIQPPPLQAQQE